MSSINLSTKFLVAAMKVILEPVDSTQLNCFLHNKACSPQMSLFLQEKTRSFVLSKKEKTPIFIHVPKGSKKKKTPSYARV